jgi:hypothetical protein
MSIKSISIRVELTGHGVVQTSGDEKGLTWARDDVGTQRYSNVVYAKGNFVQTGVDEGGRPRLRKILKISGDGLRHAIHVRAMPAATPNTLLARSARLSFVATRDALLRGWLSTSTDDRKKSAYAITAAEDKDAVLQIELQSNSAPKDRTEGVTDTSLFARETTGATNYVAEGFVNIEELRFISVSDVYGRRAIQDDEVDIFRDLLSQHLGSDVDEARYWRRLDGSSTVPEFGILLTNEQVQDLVQHLLRGIAEIQIVKSATGYAKTSRIQIKPIQFPLVDSTKPFLTYFENGAVNNELIPTAYASAWSVVDRATGIAEVAAIDAEVKKAQGKQKEKKELERQAKKTGKAAKAGKTAGVPVSDSDDAGE